jgi:probable addiction module antidote protein
MITQEKIKELKVTDWDVTEYLDNEESIKYFLEAASEGGDAEHLINAINEVARARGITELAKEMGVSRASLYKSLSGKTKPQFDTICKALNALGLQFSITFKHS